MQALLYLRMFKMYNREVKEYYKIVQEYQQKVNVVRVYSKFLFILLFFYNMCITEHLS